MEQHIKNPINSDLEKHLLAGCTVIYKSSSTFDSTNKDFTHILIQCPKGYMPNEDPGKEYVKFLLLQWGYDFKEPCWYEATYFFKLSNRAHAIKRTREAVTEDYNYRRLMKKKEAVK